MEHGGRSHPSSATTRSTTINAPPHNVLVRLTFGSDCIDCAAPHTARSPLLEPSRLVFGHVFGLLSVPCLPQIPIHFPLSTQATPAFVLCASGKVGGPLQPSFSCIRSKWGDACIAIYVPWRFYSRTTNIFGDNVAHVWTRHCVAACRWDCTNVCTRTRMAGTMKPDWLFCARHPHLQTICTGTDFPRSCSCIYWYEYKMYSH